MKKILFVTLCFFIVHISLAQKTKYGHFNADSVLLKMQELTNADAELQKYVAVLEKEITDMNTNYEQLIANYKANETTWNEVIKQNKIAELGALEKRIKDFQISAQEDVNNKKMELYNPIIEKFNNAVKEVAKENGYKMIFDNGKGVILYYDPEDDVTKLVEKKLGIK